MTSANDTLPAAVETFLLSPSDLDGWTVPKLLKAAQTLAAQMAERREAVGLLLWKLRTLEPDGAYGEHVTELAAVFGVADRTLREWRLKAEKQHALDPPDKRSASRQRVAESATPVRQAKQATDETVTPDEVLPPEPPEQLTLSLSDHKAAIMAEPPVAGAKEWSLTELSALRAWVDEAIAIKTPAAKKERAATRSAGHTHKVERQSSGIGFCSCGARKVRDSWKESA